VHWAVQQPLLTNKEIDAQDGTGPLCQLQFCYKRVTNVMNVQTFVTHS